MISVTNVRDFYVYMVSRHTVHLKVLERSLLLLKLIVNMLALYIKVIEEVLLYLRAQSHDTYSEWSKWSNYIYLYSYNQKSTSFAHVEDVLR